MKKIPLFGITGIILAGLLSACDTSYFDNEIEDFTFDGTVNAPLGTATYTLTELFKELEIEDLEEDNDGNLAFSYNQEISLGDNEAFNVDVPKQDFNAGPLKPFEDKLNLASPFTVPLDETFTVEDVRLKEKFTLTKKLTKVIFENGSVIIDLESDFVSVAKVSISIPSLTLEDNTPYLSEEISVSSSSGSQQIECKLSEYSIADFTMNDSGTPTEGIVNTLVINLNIRFELKSGDVINASNEFRYSATLSGPTGSAAAGPSTVAIFGDFEQEPFNVDSKTILFDFFDTFEGAEFDFTEATMTLDATSSYGFPIGINLGKISAVKGTDKTYLTYENADVNNYDGDPNPDEALAGENYAIIKGPVNFGDNSVNTKIALNNVNSNLSTLLNETPEEFNITLDGKANPANNTDPIDPSYVPNLNFFSTTNTTLSVNAIINAPLKVRFTGVKIEPEKIEDIDLGEDLDSFNNFELDVSYINEIPLSGSITLKFMNDAGTTLFTENINLFNAAPVDSAGKSNGETTDTNPLTFDSEDIDDLKNVTDIQLEIIFNSTNSNKVILGGSDKIVLSIGALVGVNITGEDDNE